VRQSDRLLPDAASRDSKPSSPGTTPRNRIEIHPDTAAARKISAGSSVMLKTRFGAMMAKARFNDDLDPRVVVGEHGWWQACEPLDAPGHDPFATTGSNFNATVDATRRDPIGGTPGHRGNVCEVKPVSDVVSDQPTSAIEGPAE
jgi:anaerobic selenocysteine-containing dehydrogenase